MEVPASTPQRDSAQSEALETRVAIELRLRKAMLGKGIISFEQLAEAMGFGLRGVNHAVNSAKPRLRGRRRIENFLGVAIWTANREHARLRRLAAILGFDPVLCTVGDLSQFLKARGIKAPCRNMSHEDLLRIIENHFTAAKAAPTATATPENQ